MNKIILATGIAFVLLFFTGFKGLEKTTEAIENNVIPKEKKRAFEENCGALDNTNKHLCTEWSASLKSNW